MTKKETNYLIRVLNSPLEISTHEWNALLAQQSDANPFMQHEYLAALQTSGSAVPQTGWTPRFVTLWETDNKPPDKPELVAACALYLKDHSYGEYVFDHAWANAYRQNGLTYYPKALVAPPFTPVPGARLLARNCDDRLALAHALIQWCQSENLSSLHVLFASDEDVQACQSAGMLLRHNVQFHWKNVIPTFKRGVVAPTLHRDAARCPPGGLTPLGAVQRGVVAPTLATACAALPPEGADLAWDGPARRSVAPTLATVSDVQARPFESFDEFLMSLSQDKRKKIRQERRKVAEAGVTFRTLRGSEISAADWDFFYACYERTYYEHGNAPYLSRDFFHRMQADMAAHWVMFIGERVGKPIATSLIAINSIPEPVSGTFITNSIDHPRATSVAYGRYWGATERVDCLHFEACYYQPLQWCIEQGFQRFEGGAQGEHKMARALLPVKTTSAHWLAHPKFSQAVEHYLSREAEGIQDYLSELTERSPFKA